MHYDILEGLANPSKFRQIKLTARTSDVDYDGEVCFTIHTILWHQVPNSGSQRQIRILADPFEFHRTQYSDRVSDVDYCRVAECECRYLAVFTHVSIVVIRLSPPEREFRQIILRVSNNEGELLIATIPSNRTIIAIPSIWA